MYSGTSDKRPSEIGTTSSQRTLVLRHHANTLVFYFTSEIGTTSLQRTLVLRHHANTLVFYFTSEIGTTSLQGKPQSVPCSEVPLHFTKTMYELRLLKITAIWSNTVEVGPSFSKYIVHHNVERSQHWSAIVH